MANAQKQNKVIIDMNMPTRCGTCKLVMKTTNGDGFCLITRKSIGFDYKHPECPLSLYESPTKSLKLKPCNMCNSASRTKYSQDKDGVTYLWYQCKKCGNGAQLSYKTTTWYSAKKAWNDYVS